MRESSFRRRLRWLSPFYLFIWLTLTAGSVSAQTEGDEVIAKPDAYQRFMAEPTLEPPAYLDAVVDPETYRVGPGDRFTVNLWGVSPQQFNATITPEATLILATVGEIDVEGMTLAEVKSAVGARLKTMYPGNTWSVTLVEIRRFRVTIIGAVNKPGLYTVTANTRASEALKEAGPADDTPRRTIMVHRGDAALRVDLDRFERLGDRSANPYLAEGDILVVPHKDPRWGNVEIVGAVQAGGMFDFVEGERVADLLSLADGLAPNADTTRIEVWRFIPGGDSALPLKRRANETLNEFYQTPLESDDRIIVRETRDFRPRRAVRVTGEVLRPGVYAFSGDSTFLRDVIDSAGGVTVSADLAHARIIRTGNKLPPEERQLRVASVPTELRTRTENEWLLADILSEPGRVVTDFVALFEHGDEAFNVALFSGDQVHIPPQTASVSVIGRVVQPGLVPYRAGEDVSYYLERAGGFSWQADRGSTFLVKGTTGAAVKRGRIKAIDAGDTIVIPTKRDKNFWRSFRETLVVVSSLATVYLVIDQATQ